MVDDYRQKVALGIVIAFTILGGIAVLLRLWSRWLSRSALTSGTERGDFRSASDLDYWKQLLTRVIDDFLIVVGYVSSSDLQIVESILNVLFSQIIAIAQSVTSWYYIKTNYVGIHVWDIPEDYSARPGLVWNFANQLLYNPALSAVKLSIVLFLRRLDSRSRIVKYLIWGSFAMVIILFITVLLVDIFQCHPVQYVYDTTITGGKCINRGAFYVSTAALNLFTDIMVLSIPIIITIRLQMPLQRKIAVCVILCLGGVATAIGVWRIIVLAQVFLTDTTNPDPTYSIAFCSSAVEVNVAVAAACGPSLKAISSRYLPKLLGSTPGQSSVYPGTGSGTGVGSRRLRSNIFKSASHAQPSVFSTRGADYEMADPLGGPRVDVVSDFEMRKYKRGVDNSSEFSGSDEGRGIMKTTDISVGYSTDPNMDPVGGRSIEARPASTDSLL
ncbi:unnamed protein product [Penicillium glandicola]